MNNPYSLKWLSFMVLTAVVFLASLPGTLERRASNTSEAWQNVPFKVDVLTHTFYPGMKKAVDGRCAGLYSMKIGDREYCTNGFDAVFYEKEVKPQPPLPPEALGDLKIVCDGNGVTGNRVQVLYAHPPAINRFAQYQASFKQWAKDADDILYASAQETGGTRHIRFVHDSNCEVVAESVEISEAAINASWNPQPLWNELNSLGYNKSDRLYMVFTETNSYTLGAANFWDDDTLLPTNFNNYGPSYTSSPVAVWGGSNAAHETMHILGAVNTSSPNTLGMGHCTDEYDRMCYGAGVTIVCSDTGHEQRFDCNHDDYFNTNPSPGSYLATHWNAANNAFLIGAVPFMKTWTGATSTSWNVAGNWAPSGEPDGEYDCVIPGGLSRYPVINTEDFECGGKLTIMPGANVSLDTGSITSGSLEIGGQVNLTNSYLISMSTLLIQSTGIVSPSANAGFTVSGTMKVEGTINSADNFLVYGLNDTNQVDMVVKPGGVINLPGGEMYVSRGTFTNQGLITQTKTVNASATTTFLKVTSVGGAETKYSGVEITLGAGGGMGSTQVSIYGNTICPEAKGTLGAAVKRCYKIAPTTPQTASVKFFYQSTEQNNNPLPNAFHYNGTGWDTLSSTRGGSGNGMFVTATGVSQYKSGGGAALPFALKDPAVVTRYINLPLISR